MPRDLTHGITFELFPSHPSNFTNKPMWYWRLVARNGQIIATSGEGYSTKSNAARAVRSLKKKLMFVELFPTIVNE